MKRMSIKSLKNINELGYIRSGGYVYTNKNEIEVLAIIIDSLDIKNVELEKIEHHTTYFSRGNSRIYLNNGTRCYLHNNIIFIGSIEKQDDKIHFFWAFYKTNLL